MVQNKQQFGLGFLLILSALMAFTSLSTDIYLPAMPQMQHDLQGNAELTVTGFLIGFAVAQLIWGPISDKIGRRKPLFIGMILFIIGSIGCALSQNIEQIVFWRVFQAFGACTAPMLARAMIRDCFTRTRAAQMLSTLTIIMAIAPIIGPLLGGQLLKISSWHLIFWLLSAIGVTMLLSLFRLPETLPAEKRSNAPLLTVFRNYRYLLAQPEFMRYTLCVTFFYVAAYAFIVGSPFVYIEYYGIAPQHYGWLFALNILGIMTLSLLNRTLVRKRSLDSLLRTAALVAMFAGLLLALLVHWQIGSIFGVIVPIFILFSTNGIIAANATAAALDGVPQMAGSAAALIGSLQYGSGIISSLLLALFADGSPWTMTWVIAVFSSLSAVVLFYRSNQCDYFGFRKSKIHNG